MHAKLSAEEAERKIRSIPHSTCAKAIAEHWAVDADGAVRAQSILWLYCWAKTGMNSEQAREASVRVFNEILPVRFASLDAVLDHEYARKQRYASRDIEGELHPVFEKAREVDRAVQKRASVDV